MARPKKNNAEYFTHDADMRNDVKIKALRRNFPTQGMPYGITCWNHSPTAIFSRLSGRK